MSETWAYYFGEGDTKDKALLGGKGCGLGTMTKIGLPVPQGYTITTRACIYFSEHRDYPQGLRDQVVNITQRLAKETGKVFGKPVPGKDMLLLSVRSGAAVSMPGMMDTVLNLGLNDDSVEILAKATNNPRFAYDSYRRFIAMYGDVVMGVEHHKFESAMQKLKNKVGAKSDVDLSADDLKQLVQDYKAVVKGAAGKLFPQDPMEQLFGSINAVFESWDNPRAIAYRTMNGLSHKMGTAVNVQEMVFGNMGNDCGTGVAFTRNPSTGENHYYGEFLPNAQGEDVVAGLRTPLKIEEMEKMWPAMYKQLTETFHILENHYREMQDVEFTIERQKLYMLQTRKGKRTAQAAVKIAVDMQREGLMSKKEAILSVDPNSLDQLLHPQLDQDSKKTAKLLGSGLPASPGAGVGRVVFTAQKAVQRKAAGEKVVLVRLETSPEDIMGMDSSQGILTARGGMTSHAAVVARGMGRCCVSGCPTLSFGDDHSDGEHVTECTIGDVVVKEGDWITLDGATGEVFQGQLPVREVAIKGDYATIMEWADEFRQLGIKTNADTPKDAQRAIDFGAEGIGLTRTEHMVFEGDRIVKMREMIMANNDEERKAALAKMLPFFQHDFEGIFEVMSGKHVIIRLLDPPQDEFFPHTEQDIQALSKATGISTEAIKEKAIALEEANPMLGFRGCRLGLVYPSITEMQVRSILQAALAVKARGFDPRPDIEVPLVGNVHEFLPLKKLIKRVAAEVGADGKINYRIGSMIEVPRAAVTADELAPHCEFLSFGTNDLTQMSCGLSREDSGVFLREYVRQGIYQRDPFQSIDQEGVGKLMQICIALARNVQSDLEIGICGEHGGEPASVEFCHRIGLSDVSCSPFRVPIARLAAAHAAIKYGPRPTTYSLANVFGANSKL